MILEKKSKLRSSYGTFKSITGELGSKTVSPEFWKKESENVLKVVAEGRKMKESIKMTPEKFSQEFAI